MKKLFLLILLFVSFALYSQKEKSTQLGQTTLEELKMTIYEKDSTASALVLLEQGNFYLSNGKKNYYTTDYYFRIKILDNEALDRGNIEIVHLEEEMLSNIKAITYNLNPESNSIEKTSISSENILVNKINDNYSRTVLTLPNVKKGSVIEYKYSLTSRNVDLPDWFFQQDIPVLQSQFLTMVPNYINYIVTLVGDKKLDKNVEKENVECFNHKKRKSKCRFSLYEMDTIDVFVPEKLMANPQSYTSHLRFLLNRNRFSLSWRSFDNRMESMVKRSDNFEMNQMVAKMIPDSLILSGTKFEKAQKIYNHIKNEFDLKNQFKKATVFGNGEKQAFDKMSQTIVAIYLYYSLEYINIPAYFVYTSTKDMGVINKEYPSSRNFNSLLVKTYVNGRSYFLDPTDVHLTFGMVSTNILNREARVLDFEKGSYWENISSSEGLYKSSTVDFKINDSDNSKGVLKIKRKGYSGLNFREEFNTIGKEKLLENMEVIIPDLEVGLHILKNQYDYSKEHVEEFNFDITPEFFENVISENKDIIFNPILFDQLESNLFTKTERKYPIQFLAPVTNIYRSSIIIPEGYSYTNPRESITINDPDNSFSYSYLIKSRENKIELYIKFKINKTYFAVDEYQKLKEFYDKVITSEKYTVKLKKDS